MIETELVNLVIDIVYSAAIVGVTIALLASLFGNGQ